MKVIITDCDHDNVDIEREIFERASIPFCLKQARTEEEVIEQCADGDIFIVQYARITERVIKSCPRLKYIVRYGVGVDTIDLKAAEAYGVQVGNVPDYGMNEVADHAVALALALARKITVMNEKTKTGCWDYTAAIPVRRFGSMTAGVIGLGRIGRNFARKMDALGFHVIGFDPYFKETEETRAYVKQTAFEEVLKEADIISLHCPAEGNRKLFSDEAFRLMKPSAVIVNAARGGIIDEDALKRALEEGRLGGAALDCMENEPVSRKHPLFLEKNVIVTPHMAWYSEEAALELKRKVAEESVRFAKGEPIHYPVNHPSRLRGRGDTGKQGEN